MDDEIGNLLMCSTKNWNYYFTKLSEEAKEKVDFSEIDRVALVEFDSENKMFDYLRKKDPRFLIDWSLEHGNPCVLEFC